MENSNMKFITRIPQETASKRDDHRHQIVWMVWNEKKDTDDGHQSCFSPNRFLPLHPDPLHDHQHDF